VKELKICGLWYCNDIEKEYKTEYYWKDR
jgi:hypothetical protein